ncbi:glycosyltransferase [bacterium]|nr:MAG: glycosyltransferase [bacterium]
MKISIITSVLNCSQFIRDNIESVKMQTYRDVEHIVIDGGSTDGTYEIVKKSGVSFSISEKDRGIYDGMNKGISFATGDIVGFLNGDDMYNDPFVLEDVAMAFTSGYDSCYGDIVYVDRENTNRIVRFWKSGKYKRGIFRRGWMPPHPTFFVRREIFERFGRFNTLFRISADYELMLRFLEVNRISTCYIPRVLVRMRTGGNSYTNLKNFFKKFEEDCTAWRVNRLSINPVFLLLKPFSKIGQFFYKHQ